VFHDPRDWALDVQVLCDVIQSHGIVGGPYQSGASPVELVFCNPDLIWRSDFERPRLGQGAFKEAFQAVYKATTLIYLNWGI
jgi:ribonucleotide monophosphatase NagD (HAD superfamily)